MPFGKRRITGVLPLAKKKRKIFPKTEEITFDNSAREDYLSGFHKRKLQRIKHAREEAAKREREEKRKARKLLREERRADLEKHMEAINAIYMKGRHIEPSETSEPDQRTGVEQRKGNQELPAISHQDAYVDEEKFTTVTVEAVDVFKDGLHKVATEADGYNEAQDNDPSKVTLSDSRNSRRGERVWTKEPSASADKKKKFRYESKAERKATRRKERSGGYSRQKLKRL
ncbi:MAG: hypothetical protein Q9163_004802 [Psora crenata]